MLSTRLGRDCYKPPPPPPPPPLPISDLFGLYLNVFVLLDVLVPSIHSEIFTSSVSKLSDLVDKNLRAHAPSIKSASSQSSTATSLKLSASQSTTISSTSTSRLPSSRPATSAPLKLDNLNVSGTSSAYFVCYSS